MTGRDALHRLKVGDVLRITHFANNNASPPLWAEVTRVFPSERSAADILIYAGDDKVWDAGEVTIIESYDEWTVEPEMPPHALAALARARLREGL